VRVTDSFNFEEIRYFKFGYNPLGKPSLFTYIYFVDGLLIDSGQRLMENKVSEVTSNLEVRQIFITHHHEDHSGNIQKLRDQFNCDVYASEECCELMKDPPPLSLAQKLVWGTRPPYHDLCPVSDFITTPNHRFQLIPIPGHASDMIALYEPERKWLFSADLYINSYISYFLKNESIADQIRSIRRVLDLDFKVMLCSHNPRIHDGRKKLEEKLLYLEGFHKNVGELHSKGQSAREIMVGLKLKENYFIKILSHGHLSMLNMVRSSIRDYEQGKDPNAGY
jgi:glyoxylase-like metal-dependent hydrolase (beta-lactamase superfamily II)